MLARFDRTVELENEIAAEANGCTAFASRMRHRLKGSTPPSDSTAEDPVVLTDQHSVFLLEMSAPIDDFSSNESHSGSAAASLRYNDSEAILTFAMAQEVRSGRVYSGKQ